MSEMKNGLPCCASSYSYSSSYSYYYCSSIIPLPSSMLLLTWWLLNFVSVECVAEPILGFIRVLAMPRGANLPPVTVSANWPPNKNTSGSGRSVRIGSYVSYGAGIMRISYANLLIRHIYCCTAAVVTAAAGVLVWYFAASSNYIFSAAMAWPCCMGILCEVNAVDTD